MTTKSLVKTLLMTIAALALAAMACFAEGSVDLTRNGGFRPYLEWDMVNSTSGISRTNVINVYAKAGETICLGSSVLKAGDGKDIVLRSPNGEETVFDVTLEAGLIDSREKELAGPNPENGGYTPLLFEATQTGIYEVEFHSVLPESGGTRNPSPVSVDTIYTNENQAAGVAAWDITVKNENGDAVPGRVYSFYLALNTGDRKKVPGYSTPLNSDIYILTKDGYLYNIDLNGADPYGFIIFANNKGLIDATDGSTLYGVGISNDNDMRLTGNVIVQAPSAVDTDTNITHYLFLNQPAGDLPDTIQTTPLTAASITEFSVNDAYVGEGTEFHVTVDRPTTCQIIVDTNKDGVFDPASDVVVANALQQGSNTIIWDGKDASGAVVPQGSYDVQLMTRAGEYHFPLLDVEFNQAGIKVKLTNYTSGAADFNPYMIYYNISPYTTANGTKINPVSTGAPAPLNGLSGVDSSNGALTFTNQYGDYKALDFWTYVDGMQVDTSLTLKTKPQDPDPIVLSNNYAYIFGRTDSLMQAHDGIYRGEASATLYRLLKQNNKLGGFVYDINREPLFSDLAGRWDRSALEYMTYIGVYDPAATAAISPDQTISRGEAFKLFALALGYTNDTALTYEEYAQILVDKGYVEGYGDGSLRLENDITRAEYCKIYNMIIGRDSYGLELADGTVVTPETYGFSDIEKDWAYETMLKATSAYDENGFVSLELRGERNLLDDYIIE